MSASKYPSAGICAVQLAAYARQRDFETYLGAGCSPREASKVVMQWIGISRRQNPLQRVAVIAFGSVLVLGGAIALFLPVVPGVFLIVAGILMLSPRCGWLQRALETFRAWFPSFEHSFKRISIWGRTWRNRFRNGDPGSPLGV